MCFKGNIPIKYVLKPTYGRCHIIALLLHPKCYIEVHLRLNLCGVIFSDFEHAFLLIVVVNGWQLVKMKKSIPDMSLPWNL